MAKNINFNIDFYKHSRDDFLKIVSGTFCKPCTEPQKSKMKIDYTNPINCECRCERVEHLLKIAAALDIDIKKASNDGLTDL